jgi:hypothetical protein
LDRYYRSEQRDYNQKACECERSEKIDWATSVREIHRGGPPLGVVSLPACQGRANRRVFEQGGQSIAASQTSVGNPRYFAG